MEKQKLKDVLQTLTPGSEVTVTFRGDKADQSGTFTVVQTKRGRGKGGSQLVELKTAEGETLVTGTPESDSILHVVTPDGTLHGFETEDQVPPTFETDATRALELKRAFKALTQYCNPLPKEGERDTRSRFAPEGRVLLHVGSTHEPFAGAFELREVELKRGRYGKVTLTVAPTTGDGTLVLDSFQHSGVIRDFTVREPQTDS